MGRRPAPLARELLDFINDRGWAFSDHFEYRGVDQAATKRAMDQLHSRGLIAAINMAPSGYRRGIWQAIAKGRL